MKKNPVFMLQPLESRCLLSATPPTWIADPTVIADQQAVQDATHQLRVDRREGLTTIHADQQAVRTEYQKQIDDKGAQAVHDAIQPLKDQTAADVRARNKELRAANVELRTAKRSSAKTILADLKAWRAVRVAGEQTAIDDAKAKLDADKKAAQDALKPIRDNIADIQDKWRATLKADGLAIQDKLEELDPALKPLFDKLNSDADALNTKLAADQSAVADAISKLQADIKTATA